MVRASESVSLASVKRPKFFSVNPKLLRASIVFACADPSTRQRIS
jgi:hypothetical protein